MPGRQRWGLLRDPGEQAGRVGAQRLSRKGPPGRPVGREAVELSRGALPMGGLDIPGTAGRPVKTGYRTQSNIHTRPAASPQASRRPSRE
ncbi:MAG: hypothetical protein RQ897_13100, partial [Thermoflexus sp.]